MNRQQTTASASLPAAAPVRRPVHVPWVRSALWVTLLTAGLVLFTSGCGSPSGRSRSYAGYSSGAIEELHLFGVPVALDLDGKKGPDGFAVRVYASASGRAKGVPISNGSLEILLFDGTASPENIVTNTPLRTWSFSTSQLKEHGDKSALGIGYRFVLQWETAIPRESRISVLARYKPTRGQPVLSAPSSISMALSK